MMNIKTINLAETIAKAREMIAAEAGMSVALRRIMQLLLTVLERWVEKKTKHSQNSHLPPSQDPNRDKPPKTRGKKKPGGQVGRVNQALEPFEAPDEIIPVPLDQTTLPEGHHYQREGVVKRQIIELHVKRHVIEYQLEVWKDERGKCYTAPSPVGDAWVRYGASVKAHAVYMNSYQLIPYGRVEDYFCDQANIPVSCGSLVNFSREAYERLADFEQIAAQALRQAALLHADETSINLGGRKIWLHSVSNDQWALFTPHAIRGTEGMIAMDILPHFRGVLVHDHWQSYFTFTKCQHALCHAHHLRELQAVIERHPEHQWASSMHALLLEMNGAVHAAGGALSQEQADAYRERYRKVLALGDGESPPPPAPPPDAKKKRGRVKKTTERNLIERLRAFEQESLLFLTVPYVPFTNNPAENDIRMTKVQQKISGCFRSLDGAKTFCRIRSFLLSAQKQGYSPAQALHQLFQGTSPAFYSRQP